MVGKRPSGKRPKVRKAPPNRHTLANRLRHLRQEQGNEVPHQPSTSGRNLSVSCASGKTDESTWSGFRIVDIDRVFANTLQHVACKKCGGPVEIDEKEVVGLSSVFELVCKKCGSLKKFHNCELVQNNKGCIESEANKRFVHASQAIGLNHAGMQRLAAHMNFPEPIIDIPTELVVPKIEAEEKEGFLQATQVHGLNHAGMETLMNFPEPISDTLGEFVVPKIEALCKEEILEDDYIPETEKQWY